MKVWLKGLIDQARFLLSVILVALAVVALTAAQRLDESPLEHWVRSLLAEMAKVRHASGRERVSKQLYLEAIEALRQRVEAAGEDEPLSIFEMLAVELVKAFGSFYSPERARFFAAESVEYPPETDAAAFAREGWGALEEEEVEEVVWTDFEAGLNASDLEDEEDPEPDGDLDFGFGDDPDWADEYSDGDEDGE